MKHIRSITFLLLLFIVTACYSTGKSRTGATGGALIDSKNQGTLLKDSTGKTIVPPPPPPPVVDDSKTPL